VVELVVVVGLTAAVTGTLATGELTAVRTGASPGPVVAEALSPSLRAVPQLRQNSASGEFRMAQAGHCASMGNIPVISECTSADGSLPAILDPQVRQNRDSSRFAAPQVEQPATQRHSSSGTTAASENGVITAANGLGALDAEPDSIRAADRRTTARHPSTSTETFE